MASVTINSSTVELYDSTELLALLAPLGVGGHVDGVKSRFKIPTYRLFSGADARGAGHVAIAPQGFTWAPDLKVASATTMATRRNYYDKAFVDALVASLSA